MNKEERDDEDEISTTSSSSSEDDSYISENEPEEEDIDIDVDDEDDDDELDDETMDKTGDAGAAAPNKIPALLFSKKTKKGVVNTGRNRTTDGESDSESIPDELEEEEGEDHEEKDEDEEDIEDPSTEQYYQKFEKSLFENVIAQHHHEMLSLPVEQIEILAQVTRDSDGNIIDENHKTAPFITKYEKARVLGERTKQINAGGDIFVDVGDDVIDGYLIALEEFKQKKIPFIIQRPLPSGTCEYWKLGDLEI